MREIVNYFNLIFLKQNSICLNLASFFAYFASNYFGAKAGNKANIHLFRKSFGALLLLSSFVYLYNVFF